jgi:hypothetical protein
LTNIERIRFVEREVTKMRMFDLLALAEEHRADRERQAWLERRRPRPAESPMPRAPAAAANAPATPCAAARTVCPHESAA